ncbi:LysR substrate-binding domain-containing protein [Bordetella sp. 2513F-2]
MQTTLDELCTFIVVVDAGSISRAAEHLGQTVSGTSRTLARLEEKLGTTLLRRTTRRLELTEEGRALLERARRIVASVEEAEEYMAARREHPAGRLRVDAATPFMLHVIVPVVPAYRARYPDVELELVSNEGYTDLIERRTDVALRIGRLKDSTLHARPMGSSRRRVLASPDYLAAHGKPRSVEDLAGHALLGFTEPESLNEWPLRAADGAALHVQPHIRCASGETLRQLALAGAGIVCLSDFMSCNDREAGRLVELLPRLTQDDRQPIHAVYYRNTALSLRITSFLDFLGEAMQRQGWL